jgi:hypothetical protein
MISGQGLSLKSLTKEEVDLVLHKQNDDIKPNQSEMKDVNPDSSTEKKDVNPDVSTENKKLDQDDSEDRLVMVFGSIGKSSAVQIKFANSYLDNLWVTREGYITDQEPITAAESALSASDKTIPLTRIPFLDRPTLVDNTGKVIVSVRDLPSSASQVRVEKSARALREKPASVRDRNKKAPKVDVTEEADEEEDEEEEEEDSSELRSFRN